MSYRIANTYALPNVDFGEGMLATLATEVEVVNALCETEEQIISHARGADALIVCAPYQPLTRRVWESLKQCRIVASFVVGYETIDMNIPTACNIVFTNNPDYCIDEVSGRALSFMLALGHKLFLLNKAVKEMPFNPVNKRKIFQEVAYPIFRMRDQTAGIIGLGRLGTATALKIKGLGMKVIAHDPYVLDSVMLSLGVTPVDFDTLLNESDFISLHTPLTAETHHFISYDAFEKMKPTCYFINTARGKCVDQDALIRALQEGKIAGAGLDVTAEEPIARDCPLLKMSNVILTGHTAAYSVSVEEEVYSRPMTQIIKALKGEWPLLAVNKEVRRKWMERWGKGDFRSS